MVALADVKLNNTSLKSAGSGLIAAFFGATNGIGLATLEALLTHTEAPTVFLVGRNPSRLGALTTQLQPLNPAAKITTVEAGDLTLVADAQKAAESISSQTKRLDLLFLSPGYLSFSSKPDFSPEGLDRITSIRFHARMRAVVTLLPLLRASPSPRVVSVLAAGQEGLLHLSDLGTTEPGSYGPLYAANAASTMTTLFFEELARQAGNERIVFIHTFPGAVAGTGLAVTGGVLLRSIWSLLKPLFWMVGMSPKVAGERTLFAATSGRFRRLQDGVSAEGTLIQQGSDGTVGSGVYAVSGSSDAIEHGGNKNLKKMRESGAAKKVYDYTMGEFERIQSMGS